MIEETLLEIGGTRLLNEVFRILYEKNNAYLPDCYHHPQYLNSVCKELGEGLCKVVMDSLKEKLEQFAYHESIERFLVKINKIKCKQLK